MPRRVTIASLLSLLGCSTSTRELPGAPVELRVTIEGEHRTTPSFDGHSVNVVLTDAKGKDLERSDVRVEVNGVPMRFLVGQGNYYDRHPFYTLDGDDHFTLSPDTDYQFVAIFPDSTRIELGTMRTPAALSPGQFDFPSLPPPTRPIYIAWHDLKEPVELRIGRMTERRKSTNEFEVEGMGPHDPAVPHRTIGPGGNRPASDRWAYPDSFLVSTSERRLLMLQAEAVVTRAGRVARGLSRTSTITATRRIQFEMEFPRGE